MSLTMKRKMNPPLTKEDTMPFGQYKGEVVEDIIHDNVGYLVWCLENVDDFCLDDETMDMITDAYLEKEVHDTDFGVDFGRFESPPY